MNRSATANATLPLGIDLGTHRVRVAALERRSDRPELIGVAARDIDPDDESSIVRAIVDACAELGIRERRCVIALCEPAALIRRISFPTMTRREREKAARFEAARFIDYPTSDAVIRVESAPDSTSDYYVGIARRSELERRLAIVRRANLRPLAADHEAFGYRRIAPRADAILDIGHDRSTLHLFGSAIPISLVFPTAGRALTGAISSALGIDFAAAERRKRTLGLAGAGESTRDSLVDDLATALIDFRASGGGDLRSIALVGNGSRLLGIGDQLARTTAIATAPAEFGGIIGSTLPRDVLRAASADWMLACGLALWDWQAA